MRHPLIFAPLTILLLSSCEPGGDSASRHDRRHGEEEPRNEKLSSDKTNRERIAAQESVGKMPQPRDLAGNVEDICPLHREKMKLREIPIVFVETAPGGDVAANAATSARYPFGAEKIVTVGNGLLPSEALTARVFQCVACISASRAAEKMRMSRSTPATTE